MTSLRDKIRYACRVGPAPAPPAGATHVLVFMPSYMWAKGGTMGGSMTQCWEFVTVAEWAEQASCTGTYIELPDDSRQAVHLGAWAVQELGHPVHLVPAQQFLKPPGVARPHREPIYWVVPR